MQQFEDKYPLDRFGPHKWNFYLAACRNESVDRYLEFAKQTGAMSEAEAENFRNSQKVNLDDLYQETLQQVEK